MKLAEEKKIPLIIDNAYGKPFPNVVFTDYKMHWNKNIINSFSLSKLGLPTARNGIIVADEEIIQAISRANAIISLANSGLGQAFVKPLLSNGKIAEMCKEYITPYYARRSKEARKLIYKYFDDSLPYYIHMNEGTFFLWLWLKDIPVKAKEIYSRLKKRNVIVVRGEYFFPGILDRKWRHIDECIRINYASASEKDVEGGIKIIADEVKKAYSIGAS